MSPEQVLRADTMIAIASPLGEGGIGVIRVSGPDAVCVVDKLFRARRGDLTLKQSPSRRVILGTLLHPDSGRILDEVLCTVMRAPHSYTGEDVVEISGHGNPRALTVILETLVRSGTRIAERGEFTKRAFLNGKMDLTQAEGVMDAVKAKTDEGMGMALEQLQGKLGRFLKSLREEIIGLLSPIEAGIDFPEEEVPDISRDVLSEQVARVLSQVEETLAGAAMGRIFREGLSAVIVGKPNVGKSSLLNALLGEGRAIVTEIPGTTRDTIEEWAEINGIPMQFVDTAGIRASRDRVEQMGIARSKEALARGDLVLLVLDRSRTLEPPDKELLEIAQQKSSIVVLNKIDLEGPLHDREIRKFYSGPVVQTSLMQNQGLDLLQEKLSEVALSGALSSSHRDVPLLTRARHREGLIRAQNFLTEAAKTLQAGLPLDLVALDLRGAAEAVGEITGACYTEDLLDRIFNEFCIGK